mgnify:CR=1 FL=1
MLWGFARLGVHPGPAFLAEVVDAVQWRLQGYGTQVGLRVRVWVCVERRAWRVLGPAGRWVGVELKKIRSVHECCFGWWRRGLSR